MAALRIRTNEYVELEKNMFVGQVVKWLINEIKKEKTLGRKKLIVDIRGYRGPTDFEQLGYHPFTGMTPAIYNDKVNKYVDTLLPGTNHEMVSPIHCLYSWR